MTKNNEALSTSNLAIILCSLFIGPFIFYAPLALGKNPTLSVIFFAALAIVGLTCVAISVYRIARLYPVDPFFSSVKEWGGAPLGRMSSTCATSALLVLILRFTAEGARSIASLLGIKYAPKIWWFDSSFLAAPITSTNEGLILTGVIMLSLLLFFTSENKKLARFSQYVFLIITTISVLLTAIICFKYFNVENLFRHTIILRDITEFWFGLLGAGIFIFSAAGLLFSRLDMAKNTRKEALSASLALIVIVYLIFTLSMLYAPQALIGLGGPIEKIIRLRLHHFSWIVPIITIGKLTGNLGLIQALIYATKSVAPSVLNALKQQYSQRYDQLPLTIFYLSSIAIFFGIISPWLQSVDLLIGIFFSFAVALSCMSLFFEKQNKTFAQSVTSTLGLITTSLIFIGLIFTLIWLTLLFIANALSTHRM